jgi:Family of unknown function (DUF6152)
MGAVHLTVTKFLFRMCLAERGRTMKSNPLTLLALVITVSILALPLSAHHGNVAYDTEKQITVTGTVTQWFWANPHSILQMDATDEKGQVVHWRAETESPSTMSHYGWKMTSFKPGDKVTVTMIPVKNGNPVGRIVEVSLPNGEKLAGRVLPELGPFKAEDPPKQ